MRALPPEPLSRDAYLIAAAAATDYPEFVWNRIVTAGYIPDVTAALDQLLLGRSLDDIHLPEITAAILDVIDTLDAEKMQDSDNRRPPKVPFERSQDTTFPRLDPLDSFPPPLPPRPAPQKNAEAAAADRPGRLSPEEVKGMRALRDQATVGRISELMIRYSKNELEAEEALAKIGETLNLKAGQ